MNKGYLWTLAAVSLFALSSGLLVRNITVSAYTLQSIGSFWSVAFLTVLLALKGNLKDLFSYSRKNLLLMLALGLSISANNGFFFTALKTGLVSNAVLAHALTPVFVVLIFSPLVLKEKVTLKNFILSILGLLGIAILAWPTLGTKVDLALIYGAAGAFFWGLQTVLEKKVAQNKADPLSAVIYKNLVPVLVFSPFVLKSLQEGISVQNNIALAVFGIVVLGIGFVFLFKGMQTISATASSILNYWEPIGAIILAAIFLGEQISIYTVIGGALIVLSGVGVISIKEKSTAIK